MVKRVYNFYAGPATLPLPALKKAQEELLNFSGTGMSLMEISHRPKEYAAVHTAASTLVHELMNVPEDYKILWLQGGASTQFYMVPLNLQQDGKTMEYVNTGVWSKKAIKEAGFYGNVKVVINGETIDSGSQFVGCIIGDHSKTGINSMLNTGTVIGLGCNIYGAGLPPKYVPSFCWGGPDGLLEYRIDKFIQVAKRVLARRDVELGPEEEALLRKIHEKTAEERKAAGAK